MALGLESNCFSEVNLPKPNPTYRADWRWVQGAVFVPTSAVSTLTTTPAIAVRASPSASTEPSGPRSGVGRTAGPKS